MWIILILVAAAVVAAVVGYLADSRKMKANVKALGLDAPDARMIECTGPMFLFAVKWDEGNAYAVNNIKEPPIRIPLSSIVGCDFDDGGQQDEGLGKAVGRFFVGGAVADAMDGKLRGTVLRIVMNDPERPVVEYRLRRATYADDFRRFGMQVRRLVREIAADNGVEENVEEE